MKKAFALVAGFTLLLSACSGSSGTYPDTGKSELQIAQALVASGLTCTVNEEGSGSMGTTGVDAKVWDCEGQGGQSFSASMFSGAGNEEYTLERNCVELTPYFSPDIPVLVAKDFSFFPLGNTETMDSMELASFIDAASPTVALLGESLGITPSTLSKLCT